MTVTPQRFAIRQCTGVDLDDALLLDAREVLRNVTVQGLENDLCGGGPDAGELLQPALRRELSYLLVAGFAHHLGGPLERLGLRTRRKCPIEEVHDPVERICG